MFGLLLRADQETAKRAIIFGGCNREKGEREKKRERDRERSAGSGREFWERPVGGLRQKYSVGLEEAPPRPSHAKLPPFASVLRRVCVHIYRFRIVAYIRTNSHESVVAEAQAQWRRQRHSTFVWRYAISVIFQKGVSRREQTMPFSWSRRSEVAIGCFRNFIQNIFRNSILFYYFYLLLFSLYRYIPCY